MPALLQPHSRGAFVTQAHKITSFYFVVCLPFRTLLLGRSEEHTEHADAREGEGRNGEYSVWSTLPSAICRIARTPHRSQRPKAPAKSDARVPPAPPRLPRPTASSYPPLAPQPLAIAGFLSSRGVPISRIISVVAPVTIPRGEPVQSEWERLKPAPITAHVSHHSSGA